MEKIKNLCKDICDKISKTGWIVISLVVAVILLVVIGSLLARNGVDLWPFNNGTSDEVSEDVIGGDMNDEFEFRLQSANDAVLSAEDVFEGKYDNSVESATVFVNNTREVKVAVVIDDEKYAIDGMDELACGKFSFVLTRVPEVPGIINETLTAVFGDKVATDFTPGNIIPSTHTNLVFEKATLDDGIAKVYLRGEFAEESEDSCNKTLAVTQIVETVKQFDTVSEVEIYQNLQKIN
jgi:hypothetical protein